MFLHLSICSTFGTIQTGNACFELDKNVLIIGRTQADLVLEDPYVSDTHALVYATEQDRVFIRDFNSSNGTYVNGKRILDCELKKGAKIKVGKTYICLLYIFSKGSIRRKYALNHQLQLLGQNDKI